MTSLKSNFFHVYGIKSHDRIFPIANFPSQQHKLNQNHYNNNLILNLKSETLPTVYAFIGNDKFVCI